MNDEKTKGLVIKLIDYKEADKLATIFTLDYGIITAKFKGVRKDKAKFKAIAQPFTFADFSFVGKGSSCVVSSADIIDNFYEILTNYNKTICGYIVLDIVKSIIPTEKVEKDLFLLTLSALKNIEQNNEYVATIDYILKFFTLTGVGLDLVPQDYVYLNNETAEFSTTREGVSTQIDKNVYSTLKAINNQQEVEFNEKTLKQILRLLHNIIYIRYNEDIKSFQFI